MGIDADFVNALESISGTIMKYKVESINSLNADISMSHFIYIEAINKFDKPTFSEVAEKLNVSKPAVTIAVNNLIKMGLVEKIQLDEDKRIFRLSLTSTGSHIVDAYKSTHEKFINRVKSILNEQDYTRLVNLLTKIS